MAFYIPLYGEIGNPSVDEDLFGSKTKEQKEDNFGVEINFAIEKIKPVLENKKIRKTGQNIKFDYLVMRSYGIEMQNIHFDTQIAGYILDPEGDHKMDTLSEKYLNYTPVHIEELIGNGKEEITMDKVPIPLISEYAAEDADITFHKGGTIYESKLKHTMIYRWGGNTNHISGYGLQSNEFILTFIGILVLVVGWVIIIKEIKSNG